jgi:hypothetical protein
MTPQQALEALLLRIRRQERLVLLLQKTSLRQLRTINGIERRLLALQHVLIDKGAVSKDELSIVAAELGAQVAVDSALEPLEDELTREMDDFLRTFGDEADDSRKQP